MALPFKRLKNLASMLDFQDTDIIVAEDDNTTRKATIYQLVKYIKNHTEINSYFAHSDLIGNRNGVATLDENGKVPAAQINFGKVENTVYDGASGKSLENAVSKNTTKLSSIESGANKYILPDATTEIKGGIKIGKNMTIKDGELSITTDDVVNALGYTPGTGSGSAAYKIGTEDTAGIGKLYSSTGENTDGAMTQKAVNAELNGLKSIYGSSLSLSGYSVNLISPTGSTLSTLELPYVKEVNSSDEPTENVDSINYWMQEY